MDNGRMNFNANIFRGAIAALGLLAGSSAMAAGGDVQLDEAGNDVGNTASLQRGARNFMNYCSGCHSAKYVRYNTLGEALDLNEEQLIDNLMFNAERTFETINVAMRPDDAENWLNIVPPDLSLVGRSKGTDYLYTFLRGFYVDDKSRTGWNNTVLKGGSMPHVLWELEGLKKPAAHGDDGAGEDGHGEAAAQFDVIEAGALTAEEYDQFVRDIVNFLDFIAEPMQLERQKIGVWVMAFLLIFGLLSLMLKKEIWKDVKK